MDKYDEKTISCLSFTIQILVKKLSQKSPLRPNICVTLIDSIPPILSGILNTKRIPPFKPIRSLPLKVRVFANTQLALNLLVEDPAAFWRGRF